MSLKTERAGAVFPPASQYLQTLSELMLNTQVTDGAGVALPLDEGAERAVEMIGAVAAASGKVMLAGNGGSAAVVSHVQNDLFKAVGVRALVFTEQPLLTALANDHGYEAAYERCMQLWGEARDLFITVSSSGSSENIVRAVETALAKGCKVITLSGFDADNSSRRKGHLNFYVDSHVYGYVETAHAALTHFLTDRATVALQSEAGMVRESSA